MESFRELGPGKNVPEKELIGKTLQSPSPEQVQHGHSHTLTHSTLLVPETARRLVEHCGLHDKSMFVPDVDFFNQVDLFRLIQNKLKK